MIPTGLGDVAFGFILIGIIIGAGYVSRRSGAIDDRGDELLNRVAFFICNPALLFGVIAASDPAKLISRNLGVILIAMTVWALILGVLLRLLIRKARLSEITLISVSGVWVNANNLGIPMAVYALGDASAIAPIIMFQLLVVAPAVLLVLDMGAGNRTVRRALTQPLRNPVIIASAMGLVVALTGFQSPPLLQAPIDLLGSASVPLMLLAFGASLHGSKLWQREPGTPTIAIAAVVAVKALLLPLTALLISRFLFHLEDEEVTGIVLITGLPTAQNAYNFAVRYGVALPAIRRIVLFTAALSAPILMGLTLVV